MQPSRASCASLALSDLILEIPRPQEEPFGEILFGLATVLILPRTSSSAVVASARRRRLGARVRLLERRDVEALHTQEGLGDGPDLLWRALCQQLVERDGVQLPGHAEAVLRPAALLGLGH